MRALEWLSRLEISKHVNVRFLFKSCSFVDACIKEDVTSLYTNIPQEEGITTVCKTKPFITGTSYTYKFAERNVAVNTGRVFLQF